MAIKVPDNPNRSKNRERYGEGNMNEMPCIVCNKLIRKDKAVYVHVHGGGDLIVTDEEAATMDEAADLGLYPIGPECLRKHPEIKSYVFKETAE